MILVVVVVCRWRALLCRPRRCTDARSTGDREQQLHGEGRTMEASLA